MPYYPVNANKRTERKLTLGQLITMATRLMKASIHKISIQPNKSKRFAEAIMQFIVNKSLQIIQ